MIIGENYIEGDKGKKKLSESLVLKQEGEKFILNKKSMVAKPENEKEVVWDIYVVTPADCGF